MAHADLSSSGSRMPVNSSGIPLAPIDNHPSAAQSDNIYDAGPATSNPNTAVNSRNPSLLPTVEPKFTQANRSTSFAALPDNVDVEIEMGHVSRFLSYMSAAMAHDQLLEIELILLAFTMGIMDAVTFIEYNVFASVQTGNTIELAIGALVPGHIDVSLINLGIILSIYVVGGVVMGQVGIYFGPRVRWWMIATNTFQAVLVGIAALLMWNSATDTGSPGSYGVIALMAFTSGAQLAMARTVNVPDITTVMITAAYIDIFIDPGLFKLHNRSRTRRLLSICALFGGGAVGSAIWRYVDNSASLGVSALCKVAITFGFFFNKSANKMTGSRTVSTPASETDAGKEEDLWMKQGFVASE